MRLPKKSREISNHHFDSTIWNDFDFREDDIVIATYAKSGTTWMQQIVAQLVFGWESLVDIASISPWLDLRFPPKNLKLDLLHNQTHRRIIKTHLPVDALVFSPKAKYIFVGRDGRDVVWSLYHHHTMANETWYYSLNETPGLVGEKMPRPSQNILQYYLDWLNGNGYPFWPFWENIQSWWAVRGLPNVLLVHYGDLLNDAMTEIQRIADFLNITIDPIICSKIKANCSFENMKAHASMNAPFAGSVWKGGGSTFFNLGNNGRWKGILSDVEVRNYHKISNEILGVECAKWLEHGDLLNFVKRNQSHPLCNLNFK